MDFKEAYSLYEGFLRNEENSTEDDFFLFTEAAEMLYKHTGDPGYMRTLAGVYYVRKDYELARKKPLRRYCSMAFFGQRRIGICRI